MEYLQYQQGFECAIGHVSVLNLIINGIPSIHTGEGSSNVEDNEPVLNLIINGIPSIQEYPLSIAGANGLVLNLIINGIPSIL